jgi:hypothetical protein
MRVRWTRYQFERPERWSDDTFLLARLYPRAFLGARWRELERDVVLNAGRIALVAVIVVVGQRAFADRWLDDMSAILAYPLVLGGIALLASCALSALSYLGYLVQVGLYWIGFILRARHFDNPDDFRLALSERPGVTPRRERAPESAKPAHPRRRKLMLATLIIVGALLTARAVSSTSTARPPTVPVSTPRSGAAPDGQMPAALQGVVSPKGPMGHDPWTPGDTTVAADRPLGQRAVPNTASAPFNLDDLLGSEGESKPPKAIEAAEGEPLLGAGAKSTTRRHAPEPSSLVASGSDDVSIGVALRRGIDQAFDEAIDLLSDYRLSTTIRLRARDCGQSRTVSYDPASRVVLLCYQFVAHSYAEALAHKSADPVEFARDVARFAIAHEIGHALIDLYKLPVLGREEDAADQFAAFLFLAHRRPVPVLAAAQSFATSDPSAGLDPDALGDEHSLDQQRVANLTCWLVGNAPAQHTIIADNLPPSRRARCPAEFAQIRASWTRLLRPHMRN